MDQLPTVHNQYRHRVCRKGSGGLSLASYQIEQKPIWKLTINKDKILKLSVFILNLIVQRWDYL